LVVIFNPSLNEDYSRKWQKNQKVEVLFH
jgi:hypothetical protein